MADNIPLPAATAKAAADVATYSGDADAAVQLVRPVQTTGAEGIRTVVDWIGEVQTTPTANTLLGRLKAIFDFFVAQGSATSGQSGPLVQGAVTTAAPSYTTAQTKPLSLTTTGALRTEAINVNANGQATLANGTPVSPASDWAATLYALPANIVSGATAAMTGTTSTQVLAAPGASLRNYVTTIVISNAHATVGTDVEVLDGNGGTVLMTIPAAAVYGGAVIHLPVPLRQPTANTRLDLKNVTTGASVKGSAVGYKAA